MTPTPTTSSPTVAPPPETARVDFSAVLAEAPRPRPAGRTGVRVSRVSHTLQRLKQKRNLLVEAFQEPESRWGWASSLALHVLLLLTLGLIVFTPEAQEEKSQVITSLGAGEGPIGPGEILGDVDGIVGGEVFALPNQNLSAIGGSQGDVRPSLSSVFGGAGAGFGRGSGGGVGDGLGALISGRVAKAGGKGGTLQISLAWDDRNDLDLHVVIPNEERIFYGRRTASTGGELDVDMNVRPETDEPVENVTWLDRAPLDGTYRVQVHFFAQHARQPSRSPFTVRLQIGGEVRLLKGAALPGRLTQVATFEIKEGRAGEITTRLQDFDESQTPSILGDADRAGAREKSAREALNDARATSDPRLKAGKLRRLIQRFRGTEAATAAERMLQDLGEPAVE